MPAGVIILLMAVSVGTFVYSKTYRSSGGNNQNAIIAGAMAGLLAGIVAWSILSFIPAP